MNVAEIINSAVFVNFGNYTVFRSRNKNIGTGNKFYFKTSFFICALMAVCNDAGVGLQGFEPANGC